MSDAMRDTMCRGCSKWTHRLTPGGNGFIFCDYSCAYRYDLVHGTKHAFDIYHYIPYGHFIHFATLDTDIAWASLHSWLTRGWERPTLDEMKKEYKIVASEFDTCTTFKKGFWL